ncbi:ankyrin repeat-containing domain protein, partial [Bisporella sp. PMI_857]
YGSTSLHAACWNGHIAVVQVLLEKNADIAAQNSDGSTPLHDACWNGYTAIVQVLLEKNADITAQNSNG